MHAEMLYHWITVYGYFGVFALLMLGIIGLPIPDETVLALVGYLAFRGDLQLVPAYLAGFLGSICGISLSYIIGRTGGAMLVDRYGHFLHLTSEKMERAHQWFIRGGKWSLVLGYFVPGVRHLTAFLAGISRLEYPLFAMAAYSGAFLWSLTFVAMGYLVGKEWVELAGVIRRNLAIAFLLVAFILLLFHLFRHRKN